MQGLSSMIKYELLTWICVCRVSLEFFFCWQQMMNINIHKCPHKSNFRKEPGKSIKCSIKNTISFTQFPLPSNLVQKYSQIQNCIQYLFTMCSFSQVFHSKEEYSSGFLGMFWSVAHTKIFFKVDGVERVQEGLMLLGVKSRAAGG